MSSFLIPDRHRSSPGVHSARRVTIGSTKAARRAGIKQARMAATARSRASVNIVNATSGCSPSSRNVTGRESRQRLDFADNESGCDRPTERRPRCGNFGCGLNLATSCCQIQSPRREQQPAVTPLLRDPSCVIEAHSSSVVNLGMVSRTNFCCHTGNSIQCLDKDA